MYKTYKWQPLHLNADPLSVKVLFLIYGSIWVNCTYFMCVK